MGKVIGITRLLRDLFPDDGIGVHTALENFQNNASHTVECPQFGLRECGQFPQDDFFLPGKELMIEMDIVMDWLIGRVWEASTQIPFPGGTLGSLLASCKALELGFTAALAPPGLAKQQRTERTGSPQGGRGKKEEDKRLLFHPQQRGVPKLDPTSHTSLSPQHTHPSPGLPQSLAVYQPKSKGNLLHLS